ncbi:restriction endonuclease [Geoglobus acetivorans]|nr:restriction endonuclease [Geoglobus acetivorans]
MMFVLTKQNKISVIKRDGRIEEYSPLKIKRTITKAGIDSKTATKIIEELEERLYDGITTDEILSIVLDLLGKHKGFSGKIYDLKGSLYKLGPAGYEFEKFVARLLEEHGYKTSTNQMVRGKCVEHEIDIIAEKDGTRYLVECKFHNIPIYTGLKEVMYTYARFLDIDEFDGVWLFTNTKFSDEAKKYGKCRGVKLTGWNYPKREGIEFLLTSKNLYPITLLDVNKHVLDTLVMSGIIFCKDAMNAGIDGLKKAGLSNRDAKRVFHMAREVLAELNNKY